MKFHWKEINAIARAHALEDPIETTESLYRFLCSWWAQKFSRPLKDPLLASYTMDELCYEYLRDYYARPENDPRKAVEAEAAASEDDEWARQMLQTQTRAAKAADELKATTETLKKTLKKLSSKKPSKKKKSKKAAEESLPEISTTFEPESI